MKDKKHYIVYQITNKINDNIYIGVHITENIKDKYFGSGSNIKKAIKEFGKENFEKIILHNFDNKEEMLEKERELVNEEFIKRGDTYNIVLGGGKIYTENIIVVKDKQGNIQCVHKTDPRYLSGELVSYCKDTIVIIDENGNNMRVSKKDTKYLSGKYKSIHDNKVIVKDNKENYYIIDKTDPRYLSGKLVPIGKGMNIVKDKYGNTLRVSVDDPRYLSGELVSLWVGKKHKIESRIKMSKTMKGKGKGKENSQYGTCWIYNLKLKENKKIKKEELNQWLDKGWLKGRKIKF